MTTATRQPPRVPLRCRNCGSTTIRISRRQNMLRRTFRRDEGQKAHLHAGVTCEHCKTEWWSAHAMALEVSRKLDAEDRESEVIGPFVTRGDKELPQNKRVPLYSKGVVHAD